MAESRFWSSRGAEGRRALALLAPATFFEGYDGLVLGLALPLIRRDLGLSLGQAGAVGTIVFAGSFGVLFLLPLADRVGRRPVLAWTIAGYTLATFATAFSRGVADFTAYQFVARIFLGAEYALAAIVLVETLPQERRGRGLGLVSSMSAFGQAGAGLGFIVVAGLDASWRVLYLIGILPLLLVVRARRDLPETAPPAEAGARQGRPNRLPVLRSPVPGTGLQGVRGRWLAGSAALSFLFAVFPTAVTVFASTVVLEEWGWDLARISPLALLVWLLAVSGFFVAGRLLDSCGRRPTAVAFLTGAAGAGVVAFHMGTDAGRVLGLGLVIFFLTGSTPCVAAYAIEPFPARARGRVGAVTRVANIGGAGVAPILTGVLAGPLGGVGAALSVLALSYALGAGVVVAMLPETRGLPVEPLPVRDAR